jgi:hypothetical protein
LIISRHLLDYIPRVQLEFQLFVIFGEHQVMAQLIATRVLISPLITKDFQFATFSSLVAIVLP